MQNVRGFYPSGIPGVQYHLDTAVTGRDSFLKERRLRIFTCQPSFSTKRAPVRSSTLSGGMYEPRIPGSCPQVPCEPVVVMGDAREAIPEYIAKHPVDLVAVGSRGMSAIKR